MDSPQRPAPQLESELERFFDLTLDLLVIAGFDGYLRRVNPAYQRTLGYPMQELLVRPMLDVVHPDDQQSVGDVLSGLLQGEDVVGFETGSSAPTARFAGSSGTPGPWWSVASCTASAGT